MQLLTQAVANPDGFDASERAWAGWLLFWTTTTASLGLLVLEPDRSWSVANWAVATAGVLGIAALLARASLAPEDVIVPLAERLSGSPGGGGFAEDGPEGVFSLVPRREWPLAYAEAIIIATVLGGTAGAFLIGVPWKWMGLPAESWRFPIGSFVGVWGCALLLLVDASPPLIVQDPDERLEASRLRRRLILGAPIAVATLLIALAGSLIRRPARCRYLARIRRLGGLRPGASDGGSTYTRRLDLSWTATGDSDLRGLARFPELRELHLQGTDVTAEGLAVLSHLPALESLDLSHVDVGDEVVAVLDRLPRLAAVNLAGTRIGDAGVRRLLDRRSPPRLNLEGTPTGSTRRQEAYRREAELREPASDRRPPAPAGGTDLDRILLRTDAAVDEAVREGRETLVLFGPSVTADGLRHLADSPVPFELSLVAASLGDEELNLLTATPGLLRLDLAGEGRWTREGLRALKAGRPGLPIRIRSPIRMDRAAEPAGSNA